MIYTIYTRESYLDPWEPLEPKPGLIYQTSFTNKKTAIKERKRLQRLRKAVNNYFRSEGSRERRTNLYCVFDENGNLII